MSYEEPSEYSMDDLEFDQKKSKTAHDEELKTSIIDPTQAYSNIDLYQK
jgi:hypothetical protein